MDLDGNVYRIGDGSKYWIVNEKENLAQRGEPYRAMSDSLIHVLEAVGLTGRFMHLLNFLKRFCPPDERSADVLMYRMETKQRETSLWVEATLDSNVNGSSARN